MRSRSYIATPPGTTIKEQLNDDAETARQFPYTHSTGENTVQTWIDGDDAEGVIPSFSESGQYAYGLETGCILRKIHLVPAPETQEDWAIPFGQDEIRTMLNQAKEVLRWYDNMRNPVPAWYSKGDF